MREWLRRKLLEKLGGYPDAESALAAVSSDEERRKILNLAVSRLFNTVSGEDILKQTPDLEWVYMGKVLPSGTRQLLMAEAEQLLDMKLWEILRTEIRHQANRVMFTRSKSELDLNVGKLWLHTFTVIERRLKSMVKGVGNVEVKKKG